MPHRSTLALVALVLTASAGCDSQAESRAEQQRDATGLGEDNSGRGQPAQPSVVVAAMEEVDDGDPKTPPRRPRRLMQVDNGDLSILHPDLSDVDITNNVVWNPGHTHVAFERIDGEADECDRLPRSIWVVAADGSGLTRLSAESSGHDLWWTHDGSGVVYTIDDVRPTEGAGDCARYGSSVFFAPLDGSGARQLSPEVQPPGSTPLSSSEPDYVDPEPCGPDSVLMSSIAMFPVGNTRVSKSTFWIADTASGSARMVVGPTQWQAAFGGGQDLIDKGGSSPSCSRDGDRLVFGYTNFAQTADLSREETDKTIEGVGIVDLTEPDPIPRILVETGMRDVHNPTFSPDGRMIAVGVDVEELTGALGRHPIELMLVDASDGTVRSSVTMESATLAPRWHPTENRLLISAGADRVAVDAGTGEDSPVELTTLEDTARFAAEWGIDNVIGYDPETERAGVMW